MEQSSVIFFFSNRLIVISRTQKNDNVTASGHDTTEKGGRDATRSGERYTSRENRGGDRGKRRNGGDTALRVRAETDRRRGDRTPRGRPAEHILITTTRRRQRRRRRLMSY